MEKEISRIKTFITDFNNEQNQSPTSEEIAHTRIANYALEQEEVKGQVIDWVLNYLDNRKCPGSLALFIAKEIAEQVSATSLQNETEDANKALNASNVYADAMNKIPVICKAFSNQDNLESICSVKYETSVFAIKNKRRKMEDRHVVYHDLNALLDLKGAPHHSYYAVFDGHSGIDAACYASAHLHMNIAKHPEFLTDIAKAIREGYQITDLNFLNKCNKWSIKSGSTAVCAFIRDNTVFLSWLGDSQAVLVKGGRPALVTSPHKPDREDEKKRIESLGGHISYQGTWRVNGLLAVTRAIGDPDQKLFISGDPELTTINLDGTEDFLILACDGLWDGLSPEDVTGVLYRYLAYSSPDEPIEAVAAKLVHQSKLQGSEDNITAIVIFMRDINEIKENAIKFLSHPPNCVQDYDFMSMNGNMKMHSMELNSDAPFAKPTVLELNAASSKKLKNAANVMSCAGFGSASYGYQYVENSECSYQTADPTEVDSAQSISASCFAPEATALSELPTPPIDDILASQQSEKFYATDLYKNSMQFSQNVALVDIVDRNVDMSPGSKEVTESPIVEVPVCPVSDIVDNMSLLSTEDNILPNPDSKISPEEAVDIASTVVSATIETAVKCITSDEAQDSTPVQSQLNPYAKPFVMKSFFSPGESDSSTILTDNKSDDIFSMPSDKANKGDILLITETVADIHTESVINQDVSSILETAPSSSEELNTSTSAETVPKCPDHLDQPLLGDNFSSGQNVISVTESKISELRSDYEQITEDVAVTSLVNDVNKDISSNKLSNILEIQKDIFDSGSISEFLACKETVSKISHEEITQENKLNDVSDLLNTTQDDVLSLEIDSSDENIQIDVMNILPTSEKNKNSNLSPISPEKTIPPAKISENCLSEQNQNFNASNISSGHENSDLDFSGFDVVKKSSTVVESVFLVNVPVEPDIKSEEALTLDPSYLPAINAKETDKPECNQNSDVSNISEVMSSEKASSIEVELKSKCKEIEKCIVEAVCKDGIPETLIEPLSLVKIKDELIPGGTDVPSDPSAEDSRIETVAVDLKSLPEGIPEAEGVTEDIDSDSEKDGGWSYMKGNIASGSKAKPGEKTRKSDKTNEVKSSVAPKGKREISKPNVDVKSKVKNIANADKPISSLADKSKPMPDKTKTYTSVDRTKSTTIVDKAKTTAAVDKAKTTTAVDKAKTTTAVDKAKSVVSADKTKTLVSADKARTLASADKTKALVSVDKTKKTVGEKKPDVKTRVMKASTLTVTSKTTADKMSRVTVTSNNKKETSETTKTTSTVTKSTRPSTLLRSTAATSKSASTTITDQSAPNKMAAKARATATENKPAVKIASSSTVTKASTQNKPSSVSSRIVPVRPVTTVSKTSTMPKPSVQKSAGDSKLKQTAYAAASTTSRKPLVPATKKSEVKEVKDSVNKQIVAKKNISSVRVESSSTFTGRKIAMANSKSTVNKSPGISKSETSKRNVPKATGLKSVKNEASKVSQDSCKNIEDRVEPVLCKTEETLNNLNIESDQKNVDEIISVTEEKFILESSNQEKIVKEVVSQEEQVIIENSSLIHPVAPVEVEMPLEESTPESLL